MQRVLSQGVTVCTESGCCVAACTESATSLSMHRVLSQGVVLQVDRVQALYNFEAEETGELSFTKGTILTITEKPDPNWWMGVDPNGTSGLIPSTYVKNI